MDGAPILGSRHLLVIHNNQPNDGVGGGGYTWEEMQPGGTRGGGRLLIVLGGELSVGKIGNRESNGALDFDGFCWMGGRNI